MALATGRATDWAMVESDLGETVTLQRLSSVDLDTSTGVLSRTESDEEITAVFAHYNSNVKSDPSGLPNGEPEDRLVMKCKVDTAPARRDRVVRGSDTYEVLSVTGSVVYRCELRRVG